nr:putative C-type lectin domain family 20 member A [Misgurnus anguillicaudatus]
MKRLIHLLIFSGLCLFTQSISCQYILIQTQMSWDEAQSYCRQNYFDLVTVQNNEDWKLLQETVQSATVSAAWTGLYNDIYSWRWSYQDENVTFNSWYTPEPNNVLGIEECGNTDSTGWSDWPCTSKHPFLCFNETATVSDRFVLITDEMTWPEAQNYCRQNYTDLATIQNQADKDLLTTKIGTNTQPWIGLFRDSWKWSDGSKVSSIRWKSSTRNTDGKDQRPCGAAGPDGLIVDQFCSDPLPFICLKYSKKQIVRTEIKSGLNLNDPAVMEKILQLVKYSTICVEH